MKTPDLLPADVLRQLVDHLDEMVIITKATPLSGNGPEIVYVNPAVTEVTGYGAAEMIGRTPRLLQGADTDPAARARIRAALEAGEGCRETLLNYAKNGEPYWFDIQIVPITTTTGERYFAAVQRNVTRERADRQRLERLARHDPVTGLANRYAFDEHLAHLLAGTRRADASNALLLCDLDGLKRVNDGQGHLAGDAVLRGVGAHLARLCRDEDFVARIGGDEFGLVIRDVCAADVDALVARFTRDITGLEDLVAGPVALSGGLALFFAGEEPRAVFSRADRALYRAKAAGGARIAVAQGHRDD